MDGDRGWRIFSFSRLARRKKPDTSWWMRTVTELHFSTTYLRSNSFENGVNQLKIAIKTSPKKSQVNRNRKYLPFHINYNKYFSTAVSDIETDERSNNEKMIQNTN